MLRKKDYASATDYSKLIDSKMLVKDVSKGKLVEKFMNDYQQIPLDVVSIAQARETIAQANSASKPLVNQEVDKRTNANILLVLDYV